MWLYLCPRISASYVIHIYSMVFYFCQFGAKIGGQFAALSLRIWSFGMKI